jgi:predicted PurR-regulated permease PerM
MSAAEKKPLVGQGKAAPETPMDLRRLHLWQIQPVRDVLVVASLVGVLYLGWVLSMLTVPVLLALALAYLFDPVVRRVSRRLRVPRSVATGMIISGSVMVVAVPSLLGITFAVFQGVAYAGRIGEQAVLLQKVAMEPKNPAHIEALGAGGWRTLGRYVRDFELGNLGAIKPNGVEGEAGTQGPGPGPAPETGPAPGPAPGLTPGPVIESNTPDVPSGASGGGVAPTEGQATDVAADSAADPAADPSNGAVEGEEHGVRGVIDSGKELFDQKVAWLVGWARDNAGTIGRAMRQLFGTGADALGLVAGFVKSVTLLVFSLFLTIFFFFFFSSQWQGVSETLLSLIPAANREKAIGLLSKMDTVIAAFIRGRLTIMAVMAGLYVVAYWVIGVPAPLIVGLIVGLLSAVPYMALIGIPLSIALMFLMPVGEPHSFWYVILVPTLTYWVIQLSDDYIWTPLIQGKATDMDTPTILFAVLAGGILAGIYGVLLAIPIGACFKIVLKEVLIPRFRAWADGRARDFLPISGEHAEPEVPTPEQGQLGG